MTEQELVQIIVACGVDKRELTGRIARAMLQALAAEKPEHERQMAMARKIMDEDHELLNMLGDS